MQRMVIGYSDRFESLLHAILLANVTGHTLLPKSLIGSTDEDTFVDVDQLDWERIYKDHQMKYGPVSWIERANDQYAQIRERVSQLLARRKIESYITSVERLQKAIKFGSAE